jgi:hypothetical protein
VLFDDRNDFAPRFISAAAPQSGHLRKIGGMDNLGPGKRCCKVLGIRRLAGSNHDHFSFELRRLLGQ